jgi:uncharacterized membrane protein YedE/YeeE
MLLTGRIAGISGIFAGCLSFSIDDKNWRIAFVAGLLVGFGTRLSGGCTSGHGVCGIARLSARSLVATAIFMTTAVVVVAVSRHVLGG